MANTYKISVRLTRDEIRRLDRQAAGLGISRSDLVRAMLSGGAMTGTDDATDTIKAMRGEINAAFDELLKKLTEIIRVPSFTEWRARKSAELDRRRENESNLDYLLRLATAYYTAYGVWPDPDDRDRFGPIPPDVDKAKFPRHPPK